MARTIMEKERVAAEIAERLAHQWEQPSWREAEPLHRVAEAFRRSVSADAELAEAVRAARADGYSWSARPGRSRGRWPWWRAVGRVSGPAACPPEVQEHRQDMGTRPAAAFRRQSSSPP